MVSLSYVNGVCVLSPALPEEVGLKGGLIGPGGGSPGVAVQAGSWVEGYQVDSLQRLGERWNGPGLQISGR